MISRSSRLGLAAGSLCVGYATEAASAALRDAFDRVAREVVLGYTSQDNLRSQAVMAKLGLERRPALDFTQNYEGFGPWNALVWTGSSGWTEPPNRTTEVADV